MFLRIFFFFRGEFEIDGTQFAINIQDTGDEIHVFVMKGRLKQKIMF
jgi:hypothetical protein